MESENRPNTYVNVIVPLALQGAFTYLLPLELVERTAVGSRVIVPFGKRRFYTGIVVTVHHDCPPEGVEIKAVSDVVGTTPALLPWQIELWRWMSHYYLCTPGEVMKAALPSGMKIESETVVTLNADSSPDTLPTGRAADVISLLEKEKSMSVEAMERKLHTTGLIAVVRKLVEAGAVKVKESMTRTFRPKTETRIRLCPAYFNEEKLHSLLDALESRKPTQRQATVVMKYLELSRASAALNLGNAALLAEVTKASLMDETDGAESALLALRKKGVLEIYKAEVDRLKTQHAATPIAGKALSEAQQRAFDQIQDCFKTKDVCLLHGVTSSGKTEIYIELIKQEIAAGRQVLFLLPEIALTTQITSRLGRVFGEKMGVYHSKFPDEERVELWQRQLSDRAFPLILGVRSSLFLPFRNLGLVIVDEEHETSYKQQDPAPRYGARDTALVMARLAGQAARGQAAKVVLGTATPSLESYCNATERGRFGLVTLSERFGGVTMPEIIVENVKELRRKKMMKTPFSPRLTEEIRAALASGQQAILFQNRRGYSPVIECHTCGWSPRCTACDVTLTFHQSIGKLVCHYCGATYDIPKQCPNCHETDLRDLGYGTEKIEAAAKAVFPGARTARMDLDTTRSRSAYEKIISDFQQGETDILIGTQMVTKGLDFDKVKVVGIINADQMLSMPDFRAYERAFQMMSQVAGRAGRRGSRGTVILQTKQPDLHVVSQIVHNDYAGMYTEQMAERKEYNYPPFSRIVLVYLKHRNEGTVRAASEMMAALLRPHFGSNLLGPESPSVARVQRQYIRKIMLKVPLALKASGVRRTLLAARDVILSRSDMKSVQIYFDVDPL